MKTKTQIPSHLPFCSSECCLRERATGEVQLTSIRWAAQLRPTYVEAHLKLAHALAHEGDRARAFDEYNRVAKLSASALERAYSQMFANHWLANDMRNLGNYADAASAYQAAIYVKANDSAAHCQLALILARQGHLSRAVREYRCRLSADEATRIQRQRMPGHCLIMSLIRLSRAADQDKQPKPSPNFAKSSRESSRTHCPPQRRVRCHPQPKRRSSFKQAVLRTGSVNSDSNLAAVQP
jgi:tetratricopeptide (TPR) repeat protein